MRKMLYALALLMPVLLLLLAPQYSKASGYGYTQQYYPQPSYYQNSRYPGPYGGARVITAPYWCGDYYSSVSCNPYNTRGYYHYEGYSSQSYYSNRYPAYYSSPTTYPGMYDRYPYSYGYY